MAPIRKRTRYFVGAEGESEQSFIKWLQDLSEQQNLHIHLDCYPLGGGGYSGMLRTALLYRRRGLSKGGYHRSFLIVDGDRADTGDLPIGQLKENAANEGLTLCCQLPNIEGLMLRMLKPGSERTIPDRLTVSREIMRLWPEYRKPADARTLAMKFSKEDLVRVAEFDDDLRYLLVTIGII